MLVFALALLGSHAGGVPGAETRIRPLDRVEVRLTPVARITQPTAFAVRRGDPSWYVAEKAGRVWAVRGGAAEVVLDPRPDVTDLRGKGKLNEQGMLALAFSHQGDHLYANFTDRAGDTRVRSYRMLSRPDASTARDILRVHQPHAWHNTGGLAFGPDGYLYIGLGDGGLRLGAGAQRLNTLLGKVLRIDPRPTDEGPYRVPTDNPFVGQRGFRPEIFAHGLPAGRIGGENYGWNAYEGPAPFVPREENEQPVADLNPAGPYVRPVFVYPHPARGCSALVGGFPYRGRRVRGLRGAYVFGDLCQGEFRAITYEAGSVTAYREFDLRVRFPSAFGEDHAGELYVPSLMGNVFRIDPT